MTDAWMDATTQAELVRSGEASPAELVDAAIERIEKLNPELNAVITPLFEGARASAGGSGVSGLGDGPFRGVPFLLKDLTCHSAGDPMYEGMKFLRDLGHVEDHDSHLASRFRAAGFVFVGKTNTPELGILPTAEPLAFGPTRNPWATDRSTGGSSGGSAAAVASGMVAAAHANDGGGSIRIPASECGLVGLKPTRARTSLGPAFGDVMGGLVCEHVVTRSVRDTAAILDAVSGPAVGDPYAAPAPRRPFAEEVGADPGRLRVGIMTSATTSAVHPDCVAAAKETAKLLESLGHTVEESHPDALDDADFTGTFITLWSVGNAWNIEYWGRRCQRQIVESDVEPLTWALVTMGRSFTGPQYLSALEWLQSYSRRVQQWWADGYDLLLTPTIAEPPPTLGQFDSPPDNPLGGLFRAGALVPFTPPFNVTGQPAISLPLTWNPDGLPIGSQLVAPFGGEDLLIRVASQLEQARPWAARRPLVCA
ncbi:MAG: amidase [Acidimicrobiales bacterium]|jgi:amidase